MSTTSFAQRSLISMSDLDKDDILHILRTAQTLKQQPQHEVLANHCIANCFFEPSTRTRLSFELATQKLGGRTIAFTGQKETSVSKGESLADTVRVVGSYADAIVMRHPLDGSARLAAESTNKPIINAGDGSNQHPTQTLLDLFSIQECQGRLEKLAIGIVGDLKYGRTAHSLAQACAHFDMRLYFVCPEGLEMPEYVCDDIRKKGIKFSFHKTIEQILPKLDILYMTRLQDERINSLRPHPTYSQEFLLNEELLQQAKESLRILHPLPRREELPTSIDSSPHAYYFQQAENGVYVRQALLALILGQL